MMEKLRSFPVTYSLVLLLFFSGVAKAQYPSDIKLKDYNPRSIYKTPVTIINQAAFPVIDVHTHDYAKTEKELEQWVKTMDEVGIQKSIILSYSTGKKFDSIIEKYSKYPGRFDVWCGFDYTGYRSPGWVKNAVKELERCHKKGAKGVGELGDKGFGELYSKPVAGYGLHLDDPSLSMLFKKCGELNMPVNIHVAEDLWMYESVDSLNDGLMNAAKWHVDMSSPDRLNHSQLITTLENVVRDNPQTTFIACHLANCCADLSIIGALLDKYLNLFADISARYGEISPVPKYTSAFLKKYQDRILYGTDMGLSKKMYQVTFRILESSDEHFYEKWLLNYHWPLYGLSLESNILKKIYHDNAMKITGVRKPN